MDTIGRTAWFAAGIGVGAGAAWLFGTRGGRKARRQIARTAEDARNYLYKTSEAARNKGIELMEQGKELVEDTREWVDSNVSFARK